MTNTEFLYSGSTQELIALLECIQEKVRAGQPVKAAFRLFLTDGGFRDYIFASAEEDEDEMRAALEAQFANPQ